MIETCFEVGGLHLADVHSRPASLPGHAGPFDRSRAQKTPDGAGGFGRMSRFDYQLVLQVEGTGQYRQDGRATRLAPGDFALLAATRPCLSELSAEDHHMTVGIPEGLLRRHLACPESVVAVRMHGGRGMNALFANFVQAFWQCRDEAMDAAVGLRMSYTLLDLIAAAYSSTPHARCEHSSLVAAHRVRIISYIEAHLRDRHLSPARISRACRITSRYLHHLFARETETVTRYIQRRRLEECARALLDAPGRGRTVTEIAFDYGFNSLTHFGRVFRSQYGMTPGVYRRAARH